MLDHHHRLAIAQMAPDTTTSSSEDTTGNFRVPLRGAKRVEPPAVRINLQELKARLSKVLGPKRESEYCALFSGFLSQRLSKVELDRRMLQTLGKDNIHLHNQLVKAIFRNATSDGLPPPHNRRKAAAAAATQSPTSPLQVLSGRATEDGRSRVRKAQAAVWDDELRPPCAKRTRSHADSDCVYDPAQAGTGTEEPIRAPLGVLGAAARRKKAPLKLVLEHGDELLDSQLPDSVTLRRQMERVAVHEAGLEGVHPDSANLLNHAVDSHLIRIIRACMEVAPDRSRARDGGPISILDLQVAVSMNRRLLGENWPTQLERISVRAFENRHHHGHRQPG